MLLALVLMFQASTTEATLLREYASFDHLLVSPTNYVMKQDSSYDRASKTAGNDAWFANGDAGQYIRVETVQGRTERVLMDSKGPGAVMSIWSANPAGTIRFYFDGSETPQMSFPTGDLLSGKIPSFPDPFSYISARGWNLYYPFPFSKSLKITAEGAGTEHMYYHVGYRQYADSARVETYSFSPVVSPETLLSTRYLVHDPLPIPKTSRTIPAGKSQLVQEFGFSGLIRSLSLRVPCRSDVPGLTWNDPRRAHNILRKLVLRAWFDGEKCIEVPLSDFFGSGVGVNPYRSVSMSVDINGLMTCWFPMPFNQKARFEIQNLNQNTVDVVYDFQVERTPNATARNHFKAQWLSYFGDSQPKRDMEMLHAKGSGWLVGSALYIENTKADWWGEGDEKIFVDGEEFPSFFGTGTEDFYCYAWCWPEVFSRPFHAQPRVDGPGNFGHTSVNRWFTADAIPFQKSLQFDMELWHWAACKVKFSRVTYWYEQPGGTKIAEIDKSLLLPAELVPSPPIKGAIEGESLKFTKPTGGKIEVQGGFFELSGGKQLWWTQMKAGDTIVLQIPVPRPGTYQLKGNFCRNRDYGIHKIEAGGQSRTIDFYSEKLIWEKMDLGEVKAFGKTLRVVVQSLGHRKEALEGNMFGLDYFLLEPK